MPSSGHEPPPADDEITQAALRDAWLSECWAPVRQYHDGDRPPTKPDRARRMPCDACGELLPRNAVALHIRERHGVG